MDLCEDLTRKEDQARLNRCKDLFATISANNADSVVPDVVSYLHDTWSVIRSECGKQLAHVAHLFKVSFVYELLAQCKELSHWQEIHGSILGLTGLLSVVENETAIIDNISELCLSFIGHVNIPVKEAARVCLIAVQKQRQDKTLLLQKIVALVSSTAQSDTCDTEASALQLDGLLGCLVDTYQLFPGMVASSEVGNSNDSTLQVAQTIRVCTLHPASTVRQKAGQIITLFGLAFLRLSTVQTIGSLPPVVEYITKMLTEALQSTDSSQWGAQEISLMVSEELVCAVIEIQLETLSSETTSTASTCNAMLQHTFGYLHFLKNHLSVLLGHSQFEVRRMAIQLTPQLARAYVLLNASFGCGNSTNGANFVTQTLGVDMRIVFNGVENSDFQDSGDNLDNVGTSISVQNSQDAYDEETNRRVSIASEASDTVDSVSETLHSLSHSLANSLPRGPPTILLNSSFRSVHSLPTSAPVSHRLDVPLITQMIWLNELIKENQHLFEAYPVSDTWAGNTTTSTLQMRSQSISMKDSDLHVRLAEHAVNLSHSGGAIGRVISGKHTIPTIPPYMPSAINNNCKTPITTHDTSPTDNNTDLPRGVVDHWSLDVRGRLQEIEKRTHFHRTVRSLVSAEIFSEGSQLAVLLLQNARAIVAMCEDMVGGWEKLLLSQTEAKMDFMSTLQCLSGEINSAQKGSYGDIGVTLSVDLLECVALMDSFLLSVQHRFAQCPDLVTALYNHTLKATGDTECDPEIEMLQSSAQLLRNRLSALTVVWVQTIARIQCVSKSSVLASSRAGVTGQASNRVTATQALLSLLNVSGDNKTSGSAGAGMFGADDEASEANGNDTSTHSEIVVIHRLIAMMHSRVNSVEGEAMTKTVSAWSADDVLGDIYADKVHLIGSFTNASVNLSSFGTLSKSNTLTRSAAATTNDAAILSSPAHSTHINSQHNTPHTTYVLSPMSGFSANTPSNRLSGHFTHPHTSNSNSIVGKFLSMDQWNCEAISPLLTCLANATSEPRAALNLSCIVVEWCVACVMNPLWLDSRHNAKKNLFESLVLLLTTAETSTEVLQVQDALYVAVLPQIVRALAEVLSLRSSTPLLELKTLLCCVKAAAAGVRLCMRYQRHVRDVFVQCAAQRSATCEPHVRLQNWMDFKHHAIAPLIQECSTKLLQGCEYYCEVFPLHSGHHVRASEVVAPSDVSNIATDGAEDESSETSSASSSSDEFSDWDEESEPDADDAPVTDFYNASGSVNTLLPLLWEDVAVLKSLLSDWSAGN